MREELSFTTAIDGWLAGRPVATRRAYRRDVQEFLAAVGDRLPTIDEATIQRWLATFERRCLAAATTRRKLAAVRSFLRFLHERGHLPSDRSRLVPSALQVTTPTSPVRPTERGRLLALALRIADPRLRLLLWLVGCGCPLPAVAQLRWRDLEPHDGEAIALCQQDHDRPFRCVIPGLIWRALAPLKQSSDPAAHVFQREDGYPATPRDLADAIGWVLEERTSAPEGVAREQPDRLLTLSQIAERLELPETTVRYYRDRFAAYLPAVGVGRSRRYPLQTVERLRWIVEQLRAGVSPHEIEAQLREQHASQATNDSRSEDQLAQSVDRLTQQISDLTRSLQYIAQVLERVPHWTAKVGTEASEQPGTRSPD